MKKPIRAPYATSESHCPTAEVFQCGMVRSSPPNLMTALTTPIKAPPAMKPEATSVPFSLRAVLTALSLERVDTYQATNPPISRGTSSDIGINIPRAKAKAGTRHSVKTTAITAPMPYNSHGAPVPPIRGSMTAAIAFA